jgi:hypothetical protein
MNLIFLTIFFLNQNFSLILIHFLFHLKGKTKQIFLEIEIADIFQRIISKRFSTNTTGRCVGNMIVVLGKYILYILLLSIFVNDIKSVGLYHPSNPEYSIILLVRMFKNFNRYF